MIDVKSNGNFSKTRGFLNKLLHGDIYSDLDRYGQMGVEALAAATPKDSGLTAHSWAYRLIKDRRRPGIEWYNTNPAGLSGTSVAILIQYGHGTGTGGYVPGHDFINPAMRPIFDAISADVWKKVRT